VGARAAARRLPLRLLLMRAAARRAGPAGGAREGREGLLLMLPCSSWYIACPLTRRGAHCASPAAPLPGSWKRK